MKIAPLALLLLSGCAASGALSAIGTQAPSTLAEVEQLKTAVVTAPLAGCVATVQQADMLLKALQTGSPAIPVSATPAPPIVALPAPTTAPITTTPTTTTPAPVVTPAPTTGGPVVTPNARHRRVQSIGRIAPDSVHAEFEGE